MAHEKEVTRLLLLAKPGEDGFEGRQAARVKIQELQARFWRGHAQISAWACRPRPGVSWRSSLPGLLIDLIQAA